MDAQRVEILIENYRKNAKLFDGLVNVIRQIRRLDRAQKVELFAGLTAGAIGLLGIITANPEMGHLAIMTGGGAIGMGRREGIRGKIGGAIVGTAVGAATFEGIHLLPADPGTHNAIAGAVSVLDDVATGVAVGASTVSNLRKKNK